MTTEATTLMAPWGDSSRAQQNQPWPFDSDSPGADKLGKLEGEVPVDQARVELSPASFDWHYVGQSLHREDAFFVSRDHRLNPASGMKISQAICTEARDNIRSLSKNCLGR